MGLGQNEIVLAYIFGVAIDLDHLVKVYPYLKENGWGVKRYFNWRTSLQEPVSLLWIVPLSIYLSSMIPVVFFMGHMLLDYCLSYIKQPFYPFSNWKTRGFFSNVQNHKKDVIIEAVTIFLLICLNLTLGLIKK